MLIYFLNSNPKQEVMPHHVKLFSWDFINFYHFAPPLIGGLCFLSCWNKQWVSEITDSASPAGSLPYRLPVAYTAAAAAAV